MQQKIQSSEISSNFTGLTAWRKKAKKRNSAKPIDEADYHKHLEEKYGR